MSWSELGSGARLLRAAHVAIAMVDMSSVGYLWICALSGRRDRLLRGAFVVLTLQGVAVVIGRGNCPLAPLQKRLGDPSPLLGLALPPQAAKAVFPVIFAATLSGLVALALQPAGQPRGDSRKIAAQGNRLHIAPGLAEARQKASTTA